MAGNHPPGIGRWTRQHHPPATPAAQVKSAGAVEPCIWHAAVATDEQHAIEEALHHAANGVRTPFKHRHSRKDESACDPGHLACGSGRILQVLRQLQAPPQKL